LKTNLTKVRVTYADTDAMGVTYHANYPKWFEIGRTELFRDMGVIYAQMSSHGYHLPLIRLYCHYLHPALYDQIVTVETQIDYLKRASMKFNSTIWDENMKIKLVEGYTVHACTDNEGNIVKIPEVIVKALHENFKKED